MNIYIEISTIMLALSAIIISILSWVKSRAIYSIETEVIRQPTGSKDDMYKTTKHITDKLKSGKYTILSILERSKSDKDWEIFLGKIKK